MLILLLISLVSSDPILNIYTKQLLPLSINSSNSNITVSALNVPPGTFIIASFSNPAQISYSSGTWDRIYTYYSIENYLQSISALSLSLPTNTQSTLSVSLCSFTEPIPESASVQIKYNTQLACLNQGILRNGACECLANYLGNDCSIEAKTVLSDTNGEYVVSSFCGTFFVLDEELNEEREIEIEIKTRSDDLQVFVYDSDYDNYNTLPSFLCTNNYEEAQGYNIKIEANNKDQLSNLVFSVFCFSTKPCSFNIIVENHDNDSNHKLMPLVIAFSVAGPIIIVIVVALLIKCCKKNSVLVNQSTWFIDLLDAAFPAYALDEEMRSTECSICFDDYNEKFMARTIRCGHIFHSACIESWLNTMPYCPLCRACLRNVFIKI